MQHLQLCPINQKMRACACVCICCCLFGVVCLTKRQINKVDSYSTCAYLDMSPKTVSLCKGGDLSFIRAPRRPKLRNKTWHFLPSSSSYKSSRSGKSVCVLGLHCWINRV